MSDEQYKSRMPKMMIIMLISEILDLLKKVHIQAIKDNNEEIMEIFVQPESIMHMMVAKVLTQLTQDEKEGALLLKEMDEYEDYYQRDINDVDDLISETEINIFLNKLGIKRNGNTRDIN